MDTGNHIGRAIVTILMVIYQLESDQISDRMTANIRYKRGNTLPKWLVGSFVGDVRILGLGSPVYTAFLYVEIMGTRGVEKQVFPGQNEKGQNHAK